MTGPKLDTVVYENKHYVLKVGIPPITKEFPEPYACYLVVNKEHGVTEYWHGVLPHVLHYMKGMSYSLDHPEPITPEESEEQQLEEWGGQTPAKEEKPN